jgi:hypothetical protein
MMESGMATSGELINAAAYVTGMPETTVASWFRSLREDGIVSKSGRGPSAAKMKFSDGAAILTAILGSRFEREPASKIVADFERVKASGSTFFSYSQKTKRGMQTASDPLDRDGRWYLDGLSVPSLQSLAVGHSFLDAMAGFLSAAAKGELLYSPTRQPLLHSLEIVVFGPVPRAFIEVQLFTEDSFFLKEEQHYSLENEYNLSGQAFLDFKKKTLKEYPHGDIEIRRKISGVTVTSVAKIIAGGSDG